jgi:hypothetical protein
MADGKSAVSFSPSAISRLHLSCRENLALVALKQHQFQSSQLTKANIFNDLVSAPDLPAIDSLR